MEKVFDALHDSARWPEWWKGVERADMLEPGGEDGIGRWRLHEGNGVTAVVYELTTSRPTGNNETPKRRSLA